MLHPAVLPSSKSEKTSGRSGRDRILSAAEALLCDLRRDISAEASKKRPNQDHTVHRQKGHCTEQSQSERIAVRMLKPQNRIAQDHLERRDVLMNEGLFPCNDNDDLLETLRQPPERLDSPDQVITVATSEQDGKDLKREADGRSENKSQRETPLLTYEETAPFIPLQSAMEVSDDEAEEAGAEKSGRECGRGLLKALRKENDPDADEYGIQDNDSDWLRLLETIASSGRTVHEVTALSFHDNQTEVGHFSSLGNGTGKGEGKAELLRDEARATKAPGKCAAQPPDSFTSAETVAATGSSPEVVPAAASLTKLPESANREENTSPVDVNTLASSRLEASTLVGQRGPEEGNEPKQDDEWHVASDWSCQPIMEVTAEPMQRESILDDGLVSSYFDSIIAPATTDPVGNSFELIEDDPLFYGSPCLPEDFGPGKCAPSSNGHTKDTEPEEAKDEVKEEHEEPSQRERKREEAPKTKLPANTRTAEGGRSAVDVASIEAISLQTEPMGETSETKKMPTKTKSPTKRRTPALKTSLAAGGILAPDIRRAEADDRRSDGKRRKDLSSPKPQECTVRRKTLRSSLRKTKNVQSAGASEHLPPRILSAAITTDAKANERKNSQKKRKRKTQGDGERNTEEMTSSAVADSEEIASHDKSENSELLTRGDVQDADVLCGRGGHAIHHSGNRMFRDCINEFLLKYVEATKQEKTKIADGIVKKVTERGGRFLKRVEGAAAEKKRNSDRKRRRRSTNDEDILWEVLPYLQARVKVSQRFREASAAECRTAPTSVHPQIPPSETHLRC